MHMSAQEKDKNFTKLMELQLRTSLFIGMALLVCDGMEGGVVSTDVADILSIVMVQTGKKHSINSESLEFKTRLQVGNA